MEDKKQDQPVQLMRNVPESVFLDLFREKENQMKLYQSIHPDETDVTEDRIDFSSTEYVLTQLQYSGLGMLVDGKRMLVIGQLDGPWTDNILMWMFSFLTHLYAEYSQRAGEDQSEGEKVMIPEPNLYVIYTGSDKMEKEVVSFRDSFFDGEDTDFNMKVIVLREENCTGILGEYMQFCRIVREQAQKSGKTRESIAAAIRICKDRDILKDYLSEREEKVTDLMQKLFDHEVF